jgi:general stress protein 26
MMEKLEKIVAGLIERQTVGFISSIDENSFPNTKAMLPVKRDGIKHFIGIQKSRQ